MFSFHGPPNSAPPGLALVLLLIVLARLFVSQRAKQSRPGNPKLNLVNGGLVLLGAVFALRACTALWLTGDDSFEAMAAATTAGLAACCLWLGFVSSRAAERLALWCLPLITAGLSSWLLVRHLVDSAGAPGLLGNTGYNMQLLLPGAAIGLFRWLHTPKHSPRHFYLPLAFVATLGLAFVTPVVGAQLVLACLAILAFAFAFKKGDGLCNHKSHVALALVLACAPSHFGFTYFGLLSGPEVAAEQVSGSETTATNLAGGSVRSLIWSSLAPLASGEVEAFGTGQFQASYPPLRDPAEIALTTGNHTIEAITEVEHPHNDSLLVLAENGRLAALAFLLGVLLLAWTCLGEILGGKQNQALAAGALVLLLAGSFHAPLLTNQIAAATGALLLGSLAGRLRSIPSGPGISTAEQACAFPVLIFAAAAVLWSPLSIDDTTGVPPAKVTGAPRHAIESGQLSFPLLAARARIVETRLGPEAASNWWRVALNMRPHSIEALSGAGTAAAMSGDLFKARDLWNAALNLDPAYPVTARNLERLGANLVIAGHLAPGLQELAPRLQRAGLSPDFTDSEVFALDPKALAALANTESPPFDRAFQVAALWLQSRQHLAAGRNQSAASDLTRASLAAGHGGTPQAALGLELAILASLSGQVSQARADIAELLENRPSGTQDQLIEQLPGTLKSVAGMLLPK